MKAYHGGSSYTIVPKERKSTLVNPVATEYNAGLKKILKDVRPLTKKGAESMSEKDREILVQVFGNMPRQLRRRFLKQANLKLVRDTQ